MKKCCSRVSKMAALRRFEIWCQKVSRTPLFIGWNLPESSPHESVPTHHESSTTHLLPTHDLAQPTLRLNYTTYTADLTLTQMPT